MTYYPDTRFGGRLRTTTKNFIRCRRISAGTQAVMVEVLCGFPVPTNFGLVLLCKPLPVHNSGTLSTLCTLAPDSVEKFVHVYEGRAIRITGHGGP
jgi:hypothetical protein